MDVHQTVAVVSANLGNFEKKRHPSVKQYMPKDFSTMGDFLFTDESFPPRSKAMTPRLQARIVKMFCWQFVPNYDVYLWIDSSCRFPKSNSLEWFINQLGEADLAVFKHPNRKTVQEEADYLKHRLSIDCPYITPRYENELIDEQLAEVKPSQELYASTAFIYRDSAEVRAAMKEWWYHTSRYHSIDQLSMPWAFRNLNVNVIRENLNKCPYIEYVRNK